METTVPTPSASHWHAPRLAKTDRLIGGAAGGIAEEIGVGAVVVRAVFLVLATTGWGIVLYGLAWGAMATHDYLRSEATELSRVPKGANDTTRLVGVGLVLAGLLIFFRTIDIGFNGAIVWPACLLALGAVVAWDRGVLDGEAEGRKQIIVRIGSGMVLAIAGLIVLVSTNLDSSAAFTAIGAIAVVAAGLGVVIGPWVWRTVTTLGEERRRRIRSEEKADVAAHLHDSVLQTLALIQRQSSDPQAMVSLARQQERELRDWLFTDHNGPEAGSMMFSRAVANTAAEVEQLHHVPIEVVTVGDVDMAEDDRLVAVVAAAREAMSNSARHSGAASVDVYAEVTSTELEVFIRDTGDGFDPEAVADDRRGVADSVVGRMQRAGGSATIDTVLNEGTEVTITLPREAAS